MDLAKPEPASGAVLTDSGQKCVGTAPLGNWGWGNWSYSQPDFLKRHTMYTHNSTIAPSTSG